MKKSFKKLNKAGQSVLEYATILILVMAGIIIMGPYVIRSWNATMKSYEDSALDSFNDPLIETTERVPIPPCDCRWLDVGCGQGQTTIPYGFRGQVVTVGCNRREFMRYYSCDPPACDIEDPAITECIRDNCATETGMTRIQCEISQCNHNSLQTDCETRQGQGCCSDWTSFSVNACGPGGQPPCPDGEYSQTRWCDDRTGLDCDTSATDPNQHEQNAGGQNRPDRVCRCVPDTRCNFNCRSDLNLSYLNDPGPPIDPGPPPYSAYCCNSTGTELDNTRLQNSTTLPTYVGSEAGCTDPRKCEIVCYYPYRLIPPPP